jgi:hypothetical protein
METKVPEIGKDSECFMIKLLIWSQHLDKVGNLSIPIIFERRLEDLVMKLGSQLLKMQRLVIVVRALGISGDFRS